MNPEENNETSDFLVDFQLPPSNTLMELIEILFDKMYHMFPCFHRKAFMAQFKHGTLERDSPLLLYSICCVAARYHPDISVKQRQKDWYEQAKFYYDVTRREPQPGLRTIQAAMLLIFHAWTCGDYSSSWLFLGKAWRQVVALHMNGMDSNVGINMQETSISDQVDGEARASSDELQQQTTVEKEEWRRTLWLLFILDRNHAWPTVSPIHSTHRATY